MSQHYWIIGCIPAAGEGDIQTNVTTSRQNVLVSHPSIRPLPEPQSGKAWAFLFDGPCDGDQLGNILGRFCCSLRSEVSTLVAVLLS